MLRGLMGKTDNRQEQIGKISRNGSSKTVWKRSARNKKYCNKTRECLQQAQKQTDTAKERISELEDMSVETENGK